jgi:acyl-CoA reductase-like NAD-dependent aldehyde dehydrogenase
MDGTSHSPVELRHRIHERMLTLGEAWVDGDWVRTSGESLVLTDPYLGTGFGLRRAADRTLVGLSCEVAARSARNWAGRKHTELRAETLKRVARLMELHETELADIESVECGKLRAEARAVDVRLARGAFEYYAGATTRLGGKTIPSARAGLVYTTLEPVGVVAIVTPWNFPLFIAALKLAPALAAGNTVVLKPSPLAFHSSLALASLAAEAGLPAGVLNVITGDGSIGEALVRDPNVAAVSVTGSTPTGARIAELASRNFVRVGAELGGKGAHVVFADAPLDQAAEAIFAGAYYHQGQSCSAGSRVLVDRRVRSELVERLQALLNRAQLGDPLCADTRIGPLISEAHRTKVLGYVKNSLALGAKSIEAKSALPEAGFFVKPLMLEGVGLEDPARRDEIFGPVALLDTFESDAEAVELANRTNFDLTAGIWTRDLERAHRTADALRAGTVWVNGYGTFEYGVPFGGVRASGWSREGDDEAFDAYTYTKAVWVGY